MATTAGQPKAAKEVKVFTFTWEGKDRSGKIVKGEIRASGENIVNATLRRQGITNLKVKKASRSGGKRITAQDIAFFTRQLATMMKAGVPLLQSFDIVAKGHSNPSVTKLLLDIKTEVETGSSLGQAFRKYPLYFDTLYCNLVAAGEQAGILDSLLDRLATYQEKMMEIKGKIKKALFYPISILVVAFIVTAVIMIFVIPQFKELFQSFGAGLPAPTLVVMQISEIFVGYWHIIFGALFGAGYFLANALKALGYNRIRFWVTAGALVGMLSSLLVFQYGQARVWFAMSRDKLLPDLFSKIHPKHQTPYVSTWIAGIVVGIPAGIWDIDTLADLSNIGTLFAFIIVSAAVIVLRRKQPERPRGFKVPLVPLFPAISIGSCLFLMMGLPLQTWLRFFVWLAIGLLVYFFYSRHRTKHATGLIG